MHSGSELLVSYQLNGTYEGLVRFRKLMCLLLPVSVLLSNGFTSNSCSSDKISSNTGYNNEVLFKAWGV